MPVNGAKFGRSASKMLGIEIFLCATLGQSALQQRIVVLLPVRRYGRYVILVEDVIYFHISSVRSLLTLEQEIVSGFFVCTEEFVLVILLLILNALELSDILLLQLSVFSQELLVLLDDLAETLVGLFYQLILLLDLRLQIFHVITAL